jgi:intracellular septation protein A
MKALMIDSLGGFLFLGVLLSTHSVAAAILAGGALSIGLILWRLARREAVSSFQWLTLVLVVGLGGVSLATQNPLFVMIKPSLVQAGFGLAALRPGWLARYLPSDRLPLIPASVVRTAGYAYAAALFGLATANLAVALLAGPQVWAAYSATVPIVVFAGLGLGVFVSFRGHVRRNLRLAAEAAA